MNLGAGDANERQSKPDTQDGREIKATWQLQARLGLLACLCILDTVLIYIWAHLFRVYFSKFSGYLVLL